MKDLIIRLDYNGLNWRDKCRQIYYILHYRRN